MYIDVHSNAPLIRTPLGQKKRPYWRGVVISKSYNEYMYMYIYTQTGCFGGGDLSLKGVTL